MAEDPRVTTTPSRQRGERLDPHVFELPVEKMREGYYTDAYFNHTRAALLADGKRPGVVMQVFQRKRAMLGGMDEAIAILELCSHGWEELTVHALHDGDRIEPWETVMTIEGDYTLFAHLETVYLGTLARRTLITTKLGACAFCIRVSLLSSLSSWAVFAALALLVPPAAKLARVIQAKAAKSEAA